MSALDSKTGISKPPRAKPTANASNYRKYSKFIADLKEKYSYISPREESDIRTRFFNWINENRKFSIFTSTEEKKNKYFEIAETILTLSRTQNIFDDLSDLEPYRYEYNRYFSSIQCNIPEVDRFEWMVEKEKKVTKNDEILSPNPIKEEFPEPSLSRTLRRIFITNIIIQNYLNGPYKN